MSTTAAELREQGLKRCTCGSHVGERVLPISEFSTDRSKSDGLHSSCRRCSNRRSNRRKYIRQRIDRYIAWAMDALRQGKALEKYLTVPLPGDVPKPLREIMNERLKELHEREKAEIKAHQENYYRGIQAIRERYDAQRSSP